MEGGLVKLFCGKFWRQAGLGTITVFVQHLLRWCC